MQFSLGPALWGAQQTGHVTCLHKQKGTKGYISHSSTHVHTQGKRVLTVTAKTPTPTTHCPS